MDLSTLGFAMGSAWLSGVNLYATVLTLGLLQRFNLAHLPGNLPYSRSRLDYRRVRRALCDPIRRRQDPGC